ncbi:hypothetical protein ACH5Y9_23840 [Methylomonas sp. BW4-1]|uniref:hypothetical protein n=1 Tax=Methylomonas sp. BW4-1 TaxID=3376685 RepID=UPI0040432E1E
MRQTFSKSYRSITWFLGMALLVACNCEQQQPLFLPAAMMGKVEVIASCKKDCKQDILSHAIMKEGQGGISSGVLLKLKEDIEVYRLWDGADKGINEYGGSNRIGAWWSAERPSGNVDHYRAQNAICKKWNELRWVTKCKLKPGTLVVVGPTQSASCSDQESYAANNSLQVYVDNTSSRYVDCGKVADNDHAVNPDDLLLPAPVIKEKTPDQPPQARPLSKPRKKSR